jgi:hypothetical protein
VLSVTDLHRGLDYLNIFPPCSDQRRAIGNLCGYHLPLGGREFVAPLWVLKGTLIQVWKVCNIEAGSVLVPEFRIATQPRNIKEKFQIMFVNVTSHGTSLE